jgi:hypothetical protein
METDWGTCSSDDVNNTKLLNAAKNSKKKRSINLWSSLDLSLFRCIELFSNVVGS